MAFPKLYKWKAEANGACFYSSLSLIYGNKKDSLNYRYDLIKKMLEPYCTQEKAESCIDEILEKIIEEYPHYKLIQCPESNSFEYKGKIYAITLPSKITLPEPENTSEELKKFILYARKNKKSSFPDDITYEVKKNSKFYKYMISTGIFREAIEHEISLLIDPSKEDEGNSIYFSFRSIFYNISLEMFLLGGCTIPFVKICSEHLKIVIVLVDDQKIKYITDQKYTNYIVINHKSYSSKLEGGNHFDPIMIEISPEEYKSFFTRDELIKYYPESKNFLI